MTGYEDCYRIKLPKRLPKILRIDGKAFHTFLKNAKKPYDPAVMGIMTKAAKEVMFEIGGTARMAYIQSDECSILINDALELTTQAWFDNNLQKIVSVAASIFTGEFNNKYAPLKDMCSEYINATPAAFDARLFVLPDITEVNNYFVWRQQDAIRNSVQQFGRATFSHSQLDEKSCPEIIQMLADNGVDYYSEASWKRRGLVVTRHEMDENIPLFQEDTSYIGLRYNPPKEEETVSDVASISDENVGQPAGETP